MQAQKGDKVSLVVAKRAFFFQGMGGLNLGTDGVESAVIPDTVTEEMLKQINIAIDNGHLMIGTPEAKADIPDTDGDMKQMLNLGRSKIDAWILKLMSDKNVTKTQKIALLEKMIEFERIDKNRKTVIRSAEGALKTIGGVSPVTDTEQEKIEIKLT